MNERIKELYQQAHSIRHYDSDPSLVGNPPTVYWQGEVSAQRFAELIVRECCDILQGEDIRYGGYGYNQGFLHKKIKEHFGVEE